MLSQEKYEELLDSLGDHMSGTSDLVSIEARDYKYFVTSKGELDGRKGGFSVEITVLVYNVDAQKLAHILSDSFGRLEQWMKSYKGQVHFFDPDFSVIGSNNVRRIVYITKFDNLVDITKRLLNK